MRSVLQFIIICLLVVFLIFKIPKLLHAVLKGLKTILCIAFEFFLFVFIWYCIFGDIQFSVPLITAIGLNVLFAIRKKRKEKEMDFDCHYEADPYVLNTKSGIIHDRWSESADTIKENHRANLSSSEADELVSRKTRYRFKK